MNLMTNKNFRSIKGAITAYQNSVTEALRKYKTGVEYATSESKQFKAEKEYLSEKKGICLNIARSDIERARETLKNTVKDEISSLKSELADYLIMRPNSVFLDSLRVYKDFELAPSRAEIEGLIKLNGGSMLGYRALNKVLEDAHSRYIVDVPSIADYEADIDLLERISTAPLWSTTEDYSQLVAVFDGTQREGEISGIKWDRTGLLISRSDFESKVKKLTDMESRWNSNISPSLKTIELYEEKDGKTPAQQLAEDIKAVSKEANIELSENEAVEKARKMGADRAEADAQAQKVISLYSR